MEPMGRWCSQWRKKRKADRHRTRCLLSVSGSLYELTKSERGRGMLGWVCNFESVHVWQFKFSKPAYFWTCKNINNMSDLHHFNTDLDPDLSFHLSGSLSKWCWTATTGLQTLRGSIFEPSRLHWECPRRCKAPFWVSTASEKFVNEDPYGIQLSTVMRIRISFPK